MPDSYSEQIIGVDFGSLFGGLYHWVLNLPSFFDQVLSSPAFLWLGLGLQVLGLALAVFIGWLFYRVREISISEKYRYTPELFPLQAEPVSLAGKKSSDWQAVLAHLETTNESDWKLAVIEADIILAELTRDLGYVGDDLGERLKLARPEEFKTIQSAWEAHKLRNEISHGLKDSKLTLEEARRAINLYTLVFREFDYI